MIAVSWLAPTALSAPGDLLMTIPRPANSSGFFGNSVAASDGRILIGDPYASVEGVAASGRAYLYDAKSGEMLFDWPDPEPFELNKFGEAVAIDGSRAVVGGRVHVFNAISGELQHPIRRPSVPTGSNGGSFGDAVAIADGRIVVGAWSLRIDGITGVGGAYLFNADSGGFNRYLAVPPPADSSTHLGRSVAFMGHLAVAGAPFYIIPEPAGKNGAVFIYDPLTGDVVQRLDNPDALPWPRNSRFGDAIATRDNRVVVGAYLADSGGESTTGMAYLFDGENGQLLFRIPNPEPMVLDQFGYDVAWIGDNILVAAPEDWVDGHRLAGSAYLFDGKTGELLLKIPSPEPEEKGGFGWSVADLNGDIVVGGLLTEKVYIFEGLGDIIIGDTDADGDVDIDDLNAVRNHFGRMGPDDGSLLGDTWPYDGAVGIDDLNRIRNYFGTTRHPTVPVPEPSTLALAALIGTVALIFGQRTWVMGSDSCWGADGYQV